MNLSMIEQQIAKKFPNNIIGCQANHKFNQEFTITISGTEYLLSLLQYLKEEPSIYCQQLIDLCGVDYLHYGKAEWNTQTATNHGFSRAVNNNAGETALTTENTSRFAVVYHLLSLSNNLRIRVKCFLQDLNLSVPSCIVIWPVANWYEREAFDLFGIYFNNHPNLRRILTEDNFNGAPFRKDFPLSGNLEVRFDAKSQQVIYEPINIDQYNVVPKVIRPEKIMENDSET